MKKKKVVEKYLQEFAKLQRRSKKKYFGNMETHMAADAILLKALDDLGCAELVRAYQDADKSVEGFWYA